MDYRFCYFLETFLPLILSTVRSPMSVLIFTENVLTCKSQRMPSMVLLTYLPDLDTIEVVFKADNRCHGVVMSI